MSNYNYVLRSTFGPANREINDLYSESPVMVDGIVRLRYPESAQRLLAIGGFEVVEDLVGDVDASKTPMSPEEAADLTGLARSTIYKYITNGKLPAEKTGGSWRISRAAVADLAPSPVAATG